MAIKAEKLQDMFRFRVAVDGEDLGFSQIGVIETMVKSGKLHAKPITFVYTPRISGRSLIEIFGERPWQRRDITIREMDRLKDSPSRLIRLTGCKLRAHKTEPHDAGSEGILVERVTVHPKAISFYSPKEIAE